MARLDRRDAAFDDHVGICAEQYQVLGLIAPNKHEAMAGIESGDLNHVEPPSLPAAGRHPTREPKPSDQPGQQADQCQDEHQDKDEAEIVGGFHYRVPVASEFVIGDKKSASVIS